MDLRKIKKLVELVEESGIAELEVKSGEEAVRISMGGTAPIATAGAAVAVPATAAIDPAPEPADAGAEASSAKGRQVTTPLSGTFYVAPSPDAAPFVQPGARVAAGDVLCIVESMKMMNRIEAERSGTVTAVLVANGEPVETGQPLFLLQD